MEFDHPIPDPIHQPVVPPPPPLIWPMCCHRVGGPPDYAPLMDREMEWSPIQPGASGGSSSWAFQLVCFTCSWTFRVEDVPPLPKMSCPRWQLDSGAVLYVTTGDHACAIGHSSRSTTSRLVLVWTIVRHVHCMVGTHAPSADMARALSHLTRDAKGGDHPQHSCLHN